MVQRDPLGLTDIFTRDADRISRAFAAAPGFGNGPPLLRLPAPAGGEPRTPPELIAIIPTRINQTLKTGLDLLGKAPQKIAEDLTMAADNLLQVPSSFAEELFITPGKLSERVAPSNLNKVLETVRDSAEFRNASPQDMRARMRTITDVIDLFTPT